eukprot:13191131-Alexandrium_andersonii.AAC.1
MYCSSGAARKADSPRRTGAACSISGWHRRAAHAICVRALGIAGHSDAQPAASVPPGVGIRATTSNA